MQLFHKKIPVNKMMSNIDESSSIGYLLAVLYRYGNMYLDKRLAPLKIGAAQAKVLLMLYKNESLTQVELSQILRLDRGNVTRSIKKLENISYIKRIKDAKDNRVYHIILTPEGKKIKTQLCNIFLDWSNILLKDFSEEERALLFDFLHKMIERAENILKKE